MDSIKLIKTSLRFYLCLYRRYKLSLFKSNFKINPKGFYCGKNCFIGSQSKIVIGENFYMGNNCHLAAPAVIGNDVLFASFVSLVGGDHRVDNIGGLIRLSGQDEVKTIKIDDNVWIGHGAIILHGVHIKKGSVIAAGSVVTHNVEENTIVGGNPAKFIRNRVL